jgi:hypothetical protein
MKSLDLPTEPAMTLLVIDLRLPKNFQPWSACLRRYFAPA